MILIAIMRWWLNDHDKTALPRRVREGWFQKHAHAFALVIIDESIESIFWLLLETQIHFHWINHFFNFMEKVTKNSENKFSGRNLVKRLQNI